MKNFTLKSSKQFISINTLFNLKKHMQVLVLALVGFLGMSQSAYAFDIPASTTYYFDNSQTQWTSTNVYFYVGHASYLRSYQMTQVGSTDIYSITMAAWTGATAVFFANTDGGIAAGSSGYNVGSIPSGAAPRTANYTSLPTANYYFIPWGTQATDNPNTSIGGEWKANLNVPANVLSGTDVMFYINQSYGGTLGVTNNSSKTCITSSKTVLSTTDVYLSMLATDVPGTLSVSNNCSGWSGTGGFTSQTSANAAGAYYITGATTSKTSASVSASPSSTSISFGTTSINLTATTAAATSAYGRNMYIQYYVDGATTPTLTSSKVSSTSTVTSYDTSTLSIGMHTIVPVMTDRLVFVKGASFTVTVTSSCPTITVTPSITPSSTGTIGTAYTSVTFSATGGATPYTYSLDSGSLPAGLTLNATSGLLSGTPTTAGSSTFTVKATDTNSCSGTVGSYTVMITACTVGTWLGGTSTDWNTAANWSCTTVPTSSTNVTIPSGTTYSPSISSAAAVANSVTISAGAALAMSGANTLTISSGGSFTNNNTFTSGDGTVIFAGSGTITGTVVFNNITLSGAVTNGPSVTVNGTLQINSGGSLSTAPTYACTSLLKYNSGSNPQTRGNEWTSAAVPGNVQISNNTTMDADNVGGSGSQSATICGTLTIDSGSSFYMDYGGGSGSLTIGKNIVINGNLSLGGATLGDLSIGGNFTHATGSVNYKGRTVTFNGATGDQTITSSSGETFPYVTINKATSGNVVLANATTISQSLILTKGLLVLGNNNLTLGGTTTSASTSSYIATTGSGKVIKTHTGSFDYPIGPNTTNYAPVTIDNTGASQTYTIGVANTTYTPTADGSNWQWSVAASGTNSSNLSFKWFTADSGANLNATPSIGVPRNYNGSSWVGSTGSTSTGSPNVTTVNGITNFTNTLWTVITPSCSGSTAAVLSGTATICSGASTNLQVAITGGTSPYTVVYYNGTSNITVNSYVSGTNIPVSPTATTTYSLVSVTGAAGCAGTGNSGTPIVTVTASPTPTFTAQPGAAACASADVTYTTQSGQTNYIWTVPGVLNTDYSITSGGVGTGSSTVTLKWLTAGSKTVTINYTTSGCTAASATSSTTTIVTAIPTPTFTVQPGASACANADVIYTTQSGKTNYIWTVPGVLNTDYSITSGGVGTGSNTVTLKWLTTGSKTVTINYTTSGCTAASATSSTATTVTASPTPTFTVQPGTAACASTDVTYTTQSGQTNYIWTVPGVLNTDYSITSGGTGTGSNTVTLKWLTAGSKTVTINYTTSGCSAASATSSTATTVTAVPTPTFTAQPGATACTSTDVTYTTQSGQSNYIWTVPGVLATDYSITSGGIGTGSNTVTLKWLTTGSKTVTINYTTSGCTAASATSSTATTVSTTTAGTATATASSVCFGGSTTITLTGHTGTIQWQKSENAGSTWINITGATSATYTTSNLNVATSFRAQVTSGTCGTVSSTVAAVTISNVNDSNAGNATYNTTWANAQNDSTTGFGAWAMSASGGGGFYSSGTSDVNNSNTRSWGMYAGGTGGSNSASATRTVSMGIGNTIGFSMDNGVVTSGGTVGFGLQNATGENLMELYFTGGASFYTLNDNAGAVATTLANTTSGLDVSLTYTGANTYTVTITGKGGNTVSYTGRTFSTRGGGQVPAQIRFFNSGAGNGSTYDLFFNSLSINNPVITTQPASGTQSYCVGATPTNLTVAASGTGLTYQWFSNITASNTGGTSLGSGSGAQTATYTPQNSTANVRYYYCVVTGACGSTTSRVSGAITVGTGSTAAVLSGTASICSGNSTNLQVAITGGTSPYTIVYSNGVTNSTVNTYVSGTNIPVSPTATTTYSLVSVTGAAGCAGTGNSGTPIVTIVSAPTITLETNALLICKGTTSASLVYTASSGTPNQYSIDYDATANTAGFTDVTNATLSSSPIGLVIPATANGTYNATLTVKNTTTGCTSTTYNFTIKTATITGYNLQYWDQAPLPNRACEGGGVFVFGQVYIPGVTDSNGKGLGVYVEFGYNMTNNDPAVGANGWTWYSSSTTYDADIDGTKDQYKTNFIPPSPGTYYFAYRYKLNGCDWLYGGYRENWNVVGGPAPWDSATISNSTFSSGSVILANAVAPANAGPDITQCSNGSFTMAGNAVASPASGLWTIVSGTATITTPSSATTTVTGVGVGASVTLRWTITNTGCNSTNDTVVITNNATLSWTGVTSIDWNTASNWSCNIVPTATSIVVIPSGTLYSPSIYQTANGLAKTVTINSGATLSMSNAYELTLSTAGGFTNNGSFSAGNGTVSFLGTGSIAGTTATTFNNVTIAGGVNFGTTATVVGNLKINNGGYVDTNAPTYSNTATLVYNTGGTYNRGLEWSTTSGAGYPNNITIQGNTILNVSNGVPGYKKAAGNLTVASGSQFLMNDAKLASNTDRTVVDGIRGIGVQFLGDISNSGSIWLRGTTDSRLKCDDFVIETGGITSLIAGPSNVGADIEVTGHFTDNGNFESNERAVFFTGPATQIVSGSATPPFNIDYVVVKKPASSGVVRMDQDLLIGGPTLSAAIVFGSANDIIDLNGKTLTVGTATVASNILGGDLGMFKGSASGSNIILKGVGDIGTISFEQSNPGTSNNIDTFTVNRTGAGGGVTIGSDVNVKTTVTLTAGTINLASANMTVGAAGTIAVTSPSATKMIIASGTGELRKTFSTAGSFTYPIGDNTATAEYSPVTLNFTEGTFGGYAGVRVVDAIHPNNTVTDIALTRYWPVTSTITSPTCSASFVYLDADIVGDETKYYGGRYKSGWFCLGDVNDSTNTIAASVTDFGDFTAGVFNPTSAVISRSGDAAICQGSSSKIQVAITGQVSPYSLVYTDDGGTTTYTVNNYISGTDIAVMPITNKTYSIVSVTSGNACIGSGINPATVSVTVGGITTWTGTWSSGAPTSSDSAIISSNYNISANIDACSLTVNSNSITVIPSGYNVTLSGALTVVEGSSFTLENSANLIQSGTTNPNSGNITAKRDSSLLYLLDYTLWSSPVENQNLYAFSPNTLGNRFYVYNTPTDQYYPISPSDNFTLAKAYLIRVPKNYSSYVPAIYNGNFTGKPNSGNITFPLSTAGSGYNAVGNPYPSQVNVHNFIDANPDIDGTLYFWRKRNDMYETSYATLTKSAYTRNAALGGDTGGDYYNSTDPSSWVINTAQGFIVKATQQSDLVFNNAMRRGTNNGNQFFRTAKKTLIQPSQFKLNLTGTGGIFNQMALVYSPDYTLDFDRGYEGRNIASSNYLSSIMDGPNGGSFSIQARPEFASSDIVPLQYKVSKDGTYSITLDSPNGLFVDQDIYIKDKMTNNTYNLKSGSFVFDSKLGMFDNRLEIIYVNSTLSTDQNVFTSNSVIVYKQNQEVVIHSGKAIMDNVKVYDVRGRLLMTKNNINASQTKFSTGTTNEVLVIKITSNQNEVVNKKIVN